MTTNTARPLRQHDEKTTEHDAASLVTEQDPEKQGAEEDCRRKEDADDMIPIPGVNQVLENGYRTKLEDGEDDLEEAAGGHTGVMAVVDRVLSRVDTKSSLNPGPPPDGGLRAWASSEDPSSYGC